MTMMYLCFVYAALVDARSGIRPSHKSVVREHALPQPVHVHAKKHGADPKQATEYARAGASAAAPPAAPPAVPRETYPTKASYARTQETSEANRDEQINHGEGEIHDIAGSDAETAFQQNRDFGSDTEPPNDTDDVLDGGNGDVLNGGNPTEATPLETDGAPLETSGEGGDGGGDGPSPSPSGFAGPSQNFKRPDNPPKLQYFHDEREFLWDLTEAVDAMELEIQANEEQIDDLIEQQKVTLTAQADANTKRVEELTTERSNRQKKKTDFINSLVGDPKKAQRPDLQTKTKKLAQPN